MWLGTSTILHPPSSPPFKHVLFCWKLLSLAISPTVSSRLQSLCFTFQLYLWFLFFLAGFFTVTLLLLGKVSMPRVFLNFASSHVIASFLSLFFHLHIQKSISTNYPLHLQGVQSCSFERKIVEESKLQRGSHSVGSIWTENIGVTYCSLKWMLPPVNSWIIQT